MTTNRRDELFLVIRRIPSGQVAGYGQVGRALESPISGLLVGRWLTSCPDEVPWWRVVGRDGSLLLAKRGPEFAAEQRRLLLAEGVEFEGELVSSRAFCSSEVLFA